MKGKRRGGGQDQKGTHSHEQNRDPEAAEDAGMEMHHVTGAEVTAVEAHPKRPGMYRVWIRTSGKSESDKSVNDKRSLLFQTSQSDLTRHQEQEAEDWHAEVDSWLKDAANAADKPDEYSVTVHEDTLVSMRLLKGKRLSAEEWQQLRREEALEEAYRAALTIIERKARTSRELTEALKRKGYSSDAIEGCMQRLQSRRLVDDSAYARRFAEQRTSSQRKGSRLIRQELMQRGISRDEANRVIGELDDRMEIEAAQALARKKWPQMKGELRERRMKLTAFLLRRGFPNGIVRTALEQVQAESAQEEEASNRLRPDGDELSWPMPDWEDSD